MENEAGEEQDDLNTNVESEEEAENICEDLESSANKLWGNAKRYRGVNFSSLTTRN